MSDPVDEAGAIPQRNADLRQSEPSNEEAERELRESEERFEHMADLAPAILWITEPDGSCSFLSRGWYELSGQTEREALGFGWLEAIHPDDRENSGRVFREANARREPFSLDYRLRQADGRYRWAIDAGRPRFGSGGEFLGYIGSVFDVHERREVEQALRESEERFRTLADNMSQLAWMADATGWIFWYNRRWFDYTGTTLEEMQGWGWRKVHHPGHVDGVVEKISRHFASGEPWEDTFPLRGQDGGYRWFLSRALPIRDADGRITRWFGTNTDVTEQRAAEEALREADRRKDEFLAMLAHELRNPLAPMRNAVEILHHIGLEEPVARTARDMIDRQLSQMTRLVDDLLDVSRISQGKIRLRPEPCDLAAIVRQTAADYRRFAEGNGLALDIEVPDLPLRVQGDPTRLAQVVGNLLQNAIKFTDRGGRISVRAAADPGSGTATVAVQDTGIGMDHHVLSHLFEPFTQADRSLDRSRGGLGLGLALVKGLVDQHGGVVSVHSDGPGRGSTLTFSLPLIEPC